MCRINEEMCNEARMEGIKKGKKENSIEVAQQLLSMGMGTVEDIAKATKLSIKEVQELAKKIKSE